MGGDDSRGAVDLDRLAVDEASGGIGDADHRWDAELSGDDCGMALLCADLDDNTGRCKEQGSPSRVGDRCDENVSGFEEARVGRVTDDAYRPTSDTGTHSLAVEDRRF